MSTEKEGHLLAGSEEGAPKRRRKKIKYKLKPGKSERRKKLKERLMLVVFLMILGAFLFSLGFLYYSMK